MHTYHRQHHHFIPVSEIVVYQLASAIMREDDGLLLIMYDDRADFLSLLSALLLFPRSLLLLLRPSSFPSLPATILNPTMRSPYLNSLFLLRYEE